MTRFIVLMSAIAGTAVSASLGAQEHNNRASSDASRYTVELTDAQAQTATNAFAACVVKKAPKMAARLAALPAGSPAEAKVESDIASSYCVGMGELQFRPMMLRGSIFEALYRRDFANADPASVATRAAINYEGATVSTAAARAFVPLLNFADCVAHENPSASRAVLLSAVSTSQEKAAFDALSGALSKCLANGQTLKFTRIVLRGYLAEALYNLSKAPDAAKSGT